MVVRHPSPVAIVRRGEAEVFRTLSARVAERDLADVMWDRRIAERRRRPAGSLPGRRQGERRRDAGGTWAPLGFVLARLATPGPGATATPSAASRAAR